MDRNYNMDKKYDILDLPTILLTILIRLDDHDHEIGKFLQKAINMTKSNIDIPYVLSIEDKIKKKMTTNLTLRL